MFRIKLVATILALLTFALLLAAAMLWGAMRVEYDIKRSHLAHEALEGYLGLSVDTYRHFKERLDVVLFDAESNNAGVIESGKRLTDALERLSAATRNEAEHVEGGDEHDDELDEFDRVLRLEMIVFEARNTFDLIERMQSEGRDEEAYQLLSALMERTFDQRLRAIIDEAVADEREEVQRAQGDAVQLVSWLYRIGGVFVVLSIGFAVVVGRMLLRNVKAPLTALMHGTRMVETGDLSHRINVLGNDEFAELAIRFNAMAGELERKTAVLTEAHQSLEAQVQQRTLELNQANIRFQRLDEVRRQFFADISHELRTPLTIIRGEAEISMRGNGKTALEYQTAMGRIVELSGQLTQLVDDLLFLARAETNNARLDIDTVNLNDLVLESGEDALMLARNKQLRVELNIPDQSVQVNGDRIRLRQLMHILIDNACKYSKDGTTVAIGVEQVANEAVLHVRDEGIGIEYADQTLIFERFFRSERAAQCAEQGSGLGLSLAKSIAEAHNGAITLESTVNKGSIFHVHLPAA